ncbi:DUF1211 domain-containing protein [Streptomyces mobaraensis NBRC 13819 = DSM 40847]|nr:TMEM175 family protein [Streptomyces mobaraensis]QTT75249.1 DUF1211 domain-containing protein [Streptomyces mobaraensis NBRC 13819 = DSM 40847]
MSTDARLEAGLSPERPAFFTDAIFAIAMTLLAVELKHPGDRQLASGRALWGFLVEQRNAYLASRWRSCSSGRCGAATTS